MEKEFNAAARRLAIFLHHVELLPAELDFVRHEFYVHLNRNWTEYVAAVKQKPDLEYIAYADGLAYVSRLHSVLYEFKAFLDIFARLVVRLVLPRPGPNGFNKGKVEGIELSGGRLMNWLAEQQVQALPHRDALVASLVAASHEWITEAVSLRDTLGHYRDVPGFSHMRISVPRGPKNLKQKDILPPEMPSGQDVTTYAVTLRDRLCNLVSETLPLLPGVTPNLNETWQSACRYLK
ncbi:hypothetical protein [Accumulibacter sp.]|uniref:hypothetical protein n=1 Tax=Accumulibacter sp. TaxID=2053492 RepID=UPI001A3B93D2|nr:hypothetical protein [Accumulibacter sp.]MBL8402182.1 hypothetical protein [Accumulibacter sp.]